jgi:hypothetical protein
MNKTVAVLVVLIGAFGFSLGASAQTSPSPSDSLLKTFDGALPAPVKDIFDTAIKISDKMKNSPLLQNVVDQARSSGVGADVGSGSIFTDLKNIWDNVNNWMEQNVGVSLQQIIKVIAGLFVWVLEFVIKILRAGLSLIPQN